MRATLEHLAAVAVAGVPGIVPVSVGPSPDDDADFRSAVVTDQANKRWRVRSPLTDEAGIRLAAEHSVLRAFTPQLRAKLPFLIPTVVGSVEDHQRRTFIYSHLPGRPVPISKLDSLADAAPTRPQPPSTEPVPPVTTQIGALLAAIHDLPRAMVMDADLPAYSADQCRTRMLNELDQAATTGLIPAGLLQRWENALEDRTLWRFSTHVVHGDLHEDNLVVDGNRITAVTGWSDVHVGDPALDFAWLIGANDLSLAEAVVAAYARSSRQAPDPHLLRRAHLEAEFALARWLVRGVARERPDMVADAQRMLAVLETDVEDYEEELVAGAPAQPEDSVAARTEHARSARTHAQDDSPEAVTENR
ncbi:macrolide 2'-phosphotransferase [Kocuria sp.]|uniref:macrolide 2'-phosphotransferase n=1 Tax=Kocuria sp. TaxID=1871328 RepID=UPI0026DEA7AB|nr:macrolide 2'-phosphotransferase [Kocuria sp.]MDO5617149.1 macrolide 2'-phosphotransferase [Kocuria sp.]